MRKVAAITIWICFIPYEKWAGCRMKSVCLRLTYFNRLLEFDLESTAGSRTVGALAWSRRWCCPETSPFRHDRPPLNITAVSSSNNITSSKCNSLVWTTPSSSIPPPSAAPRPRLREWTRVMSRSSNPVASWIPYTLGLKSRATTMEIPRSWIIQVLFLQESLLIQMRLL